MMLSEKNTCFRCPKWVTFVPTRQRRLPNKKKSMVMVTDAHKAYSAYQVPKELEKAIFFHQQLFSQMPMIC